MFTNSNFCWWKGKNNEEIKHGIISPPYFSHSELFWGILFSQCNVQTSYAVCPPGGTPAPSWVPDVYENTEIIIFLQEGSLFTLYTLPVTTSCAAKGHRNTSRRKGLLSKPGHRQVHVQHLRHFGVFWPPLSKRIWRVLLPRLSEQTLPSSALLFYTILQLSGK